MWKGLLNNASFAAFIGAFFAFLLVVLTDLRRRYRIKGQLVCLISDNKDLALAKIRAVETNIKLLQDGRGTEPVIMPFPTTALKNHHLHVIDLLNGHQSQGINVLIFWMEAIDSSLEEAKATSKTLRINVETSTPGPERKQLVDRLLRELEESVANLKHFVTLCDFYIDGNPHKITEFEHALQ